MKFENHLCSDIEPYTQELYKLRFPDSVQLGDICKIDGEKLKRDYPGDWIISFPCQDISIAGKGKGIHGERSGLWFEYWRLINDLRPRFAIMENVGMLIHRGLCEVLGSLAEIGYDAEWQDIRAEDVGAPHKRERIWIMAYPISTGAGSISGEAGADTGRGTGRDESSLRQAHRENVPNRIDPAGEIKGDVPYPSINRSQGKPRPLSTKGENETSKRCQARRAFEKGNVPNPHNTQGQRQREHSREILSESESERFNSCSGSGGWSTEPAVCGMVDGVLSELDGYQGRLAIKSYQRVDRLRGLGNSIVPQIAEILFRQIKPYL
jgi:DNA (cytosine-5)-methyltransferase 1